MNDFIVTTIDIDAEGVSIFGSQQFSTHDRNAMFLTEQIGAVNFRLRQSASGYQSGWHVAGDPTLIIVLKGTLRIILRNGDHQDFSSGAMFIAKDRLLEGAEFDSEKHGHRAEVLSGQDLAAVHIKLEKLGDSANRD